MISYCVILTILLLLATISFLLIKRNKKSKIIKLFEHFTIDDSSKNINDGDPRNHIKSSDLIGPKGVPQTLHHCDDLKKGSNKTFPNCCDDEHYKAEKCFRLFPKNPSLTLDKKGHWIKSDLTMGGPTAKKLRNDSKYIYNPLFPYARTDYTKKTPLLYRMLDKAVKVMTPEGSSWNLDRIDSITMPSADGKDISNTTNNINILEDYGKLLFYGKDRSAKKPCNPLTGKDCKPIGQNRWQKIGKCPDNPSNDMYAYIDVNNQHNPYKYFIPKQLRSGLIESTVQDVFSWVDIPTKFYDTLFHNNPCKSIIDEEGSTIHYMPSISDPPYDK